MYKKDKGIYKDINKKWIGKNIIITSLATKTKWEGIVKDIIIDKNYKLIIFENGIECMAHKNFQFNIKEI